MVFLLVRNEHEIGGEEEEKTRRTGHKHSMGLLHHFGACQRVEPLAPVLSLRCRYESTFRNQTIKYDIEHHAMTMAVIYQTL